MSKKTKALVLINQIKCQLSDTMPVRSYCPACNQLSPYPGVCVNCRVGELGELIGDPELAAQFLQAVQKAAQLRDRLLERVN